MQKLLTFKKALIGQDIRGFTVLTNDQWKYYQSMCEKIDSILVYYYSDDDYFIIENKEELLSSLTVVDIADDFANNLIAKFQLKDFNSGYGYFPNIDLLINNIDDIENARIEILINNQ